MSSVGQTESLIPSPVLLASKLPLGVFLPLTFVSRQSPGLSASHQVCQSTLIPEPTGASPSTWKPALAPSLLCTPTLTTPQPPSTRQICACRLPRALHFPQVHTPTAAQGPSQSDLSSCAELCFLSASQPPGLCSCCSLCQEQPFHVLPVPRVYYSGCTFELSSASPSALSLDVSPSQSPKSGPV